MNDRRVENASERGLAGRILRTTGSIANADVLLESGGVAS
jgi:hypothetical protein